MHPKLLLESTPLGLTLEYSDPGPDITSRHWAALIEIIVWQLAAPFQRQCGPTKLFIGHE